MIVLQQDADFGSPVVAIVDNLDAAKERAAKLRIPLFAWTLNGQQLGEIWANGKLGGGFVLPDGDTGSEPTETVKAILGRLKVGAARREETLRHGGGLPQLKEAVMPYPILDIEHSNANPWHMAVASYLWEGEGGCPFDYEISFAGGPSKIRIAFKPLAWHKESPWGAFK